MKVGLLTQPSIALCYTLIALASSVSLDLIVTRSNYLRSHLTWIEETVTPRPPRGGVLRLYLTQGR